MNELTVSEIAVKYGVTKRVVLGWCSRGEFPNAYKTDSGFGFEVWKIPESDVKNFKQPVRGRKSSNAPSKAALAKRAQREREKEAKSAKKDK